MDGVSAIVIGIISMVIGIILLFRAGGGFNEKLVVAVIIIILGFVVIEYGIYQLIIGTF